MAVDRNLLTRRTWHDGALSARAARCRFRRRRMISIASLFSAAHVVADPFASARTGVGPSIDWNGTLQFRRHLLDLGLGIAEAMDTAQRGSGLDWDRALELVRRSLDAAVPARAQTDLFGRGNRPTRSERCADARRCGERLYRADRGDPKARRTNHPDGEPCARPCRRMAADYETVYRTVLPCCDQPVILHWLGDMFDPLLRGYWGSAAFEPALETALAVIGGSTGKVDGIKISLLDAEKEMVMRRRLPPGVKMYTGDDFNYPELIKGDASGFSHALLGIFDPIAPAASAALAALARGDAAVRSYPGADGSTEPPDLPSANPILQDRCRVSCLSERISEPLRDAGRRAIHAPATLLYRAVLSRRRSRSASRPGPRRGPHAAFPRALWVRVEELIRARLQGVSISARSTPQLSDIRRRSAR